MWHTLWTFISWKIRERNREITLEKVWLDAGNAGLEVVKWKSLREARTAGESWFRRGWRAEPEPCEQLLKGLEDSFGLSVHNPSLMGCFSTHQVLLSKGFTVLMPTALSVFYFNCLEIDFLSKSIQRWKYQKKWLHDWYVWFWITIM